MSLRAVDLLAKQRTPFLGAYIPWPDLEHFLVAEERGRPGWRIHPGFCQIGRLDIPACEFFQLHFVCRDRVARRISQRPELALRIDHDRSDRFHMVLNRRSALQLRDAFHKHAKVKTLSASARTCDIDYMRKGRVQPGIRPQIAPALGRFQNFSDINQVIVVIALQRTTENDILLLRHILQFDQRILDQIGTPFDDVPEPFSRLGRETHSDIPCTTAMPADHPNAKGALLSAAAHPGNARGSPLRQRQPDQLQ